MVLPAGSDSWEPDIRLALHLLYKKGKIIGERIKDGFHSVLQFGVWNRRSPVRVCERRGSAELSQGCRQTPSAVTQSRIYYIMQSALAKAGRLYRLGVTLYPSVSLPLLGELIS